mgnify:CR=1 FL=1
MSALRDTRTAGALGVAGAAAAGSALATGFERLVRHIGERAEVNAVFRQWQSALDEQAARADYAEAELEKAESQIDDLLDEIADLERRLASRR